MSELVIGIGLGEMGEARRSVGSALSLIDSAKRNLNSALRSLESDSKSSRISTQIDEIGAEYKAHSKNN